jgi:hypothetical protein
LLRHDPSARANVEHRSSSRPHKVIDELVGVTRSPCVVDSRCGTEGVRARTIEVEICA